MYLLNIVIGPIFVFVIHPHPTIFVASFISNVNVFFRWLDEHESNVAVVHCKVKVFFFSVDKIQNIMN